MTHPLAQAHLAALATVPDLTDLSTSIARAKSLTARVRFWADSPNAAGMLGRNGLGPAVDDCVRQARFSGFVSSDRKAA